MVAQRANKQASNGAVTAEKRAGDGLTTPALYIAKRPPRPCECGCGGVIQEPTNNDHKYLKGHRHKRWVEDKKDATLKFLHAVVWVYSGFNETQADALAQCAVDFYFSRQCKALERLGWKYVSEAQQWAFQGKGEAEAFPELYDVVKRWKV